MLFSLLIDKKFGIFERKFTKKFVTVKDLWPVNLTRLALRLLIQ